MADEIYDGAIGIDLGTTYSCVANYEGAGVEIIANEQGSFTTPSFVSFTSEERLIGEAAKNQAAMNPENTVFDAKRLIGRRFDDPTVKKDIESWPFKVIDDDNSPKIQVDYLGETKVFSPQEISAMVLGKMKEVAETKLGKKVQKAVITVPAYFNDNQRQATKDAGAISGLNVLRIINEPTAAAIAYGLGAGKSDKERNVMIYDLGGGTFDVSLLHIQGGVFTVKATAGDTHLGGQDFDTNLLEHFKKEFQRKTKKDISGDARALRRLRTACERAKRTLSNGTQTTIEIDSLFDGEDLNANITRARFEEINGKAFNGTMQPVEQVLKDAGIERSKVDEIVLVGGSTRIPRIQKLLSDFFNGKKLEKSINPDEAVAYGAAVQAGILSGKATSADTADMLLLDVVPLSLGVAMEGNIFAPVVARGQTHTTVSPDRSSQDHDSHRHHWDTDNLWHRFGTLGFLHLLASAPGHDRIGHHTCSDGLFTFGTSAHLISIEQHWQILTIFPIQKRTFTTVADNQQTVQFPVFQGERVNCEDNTSLGEFTLAPIPPMKAGDAVLEVVFEVDVNGILKVTATEKTSGRSANITISNSVGKLSSGEIEKMVEDAAKFKSTDEAFTKKFEARQQLESYISRVEEIVSDPTMSMKLKRGQKEKIESALSDAMAQLEIEDAGSDDLRKKELALKRVVTKAMSTR
ncbi:Heat shock protein ssb1 [Elasticomyces elasticus]|nr:Heat shock protein ssb1 [Elasticomyces elasticus]